MIHRLDINEPDFSARLDRLLAWSPEQDAGIEAAVADIIAAVRARGDEAVLEYTRRFDRLTVADAAALRVPRAELQAALAGLPAAERSALELAADRIRRYHEHQRGVSWSYTEVDGTRLGQRVLPLDRVGLYVPGGKAAYPSSVLMNAIPARVAGVRELVMVVPTPDGVRNQAVLAAACLAGVDEVYTIGGAQAVAALAHGTPMIRPVDKIVGPGNAFVAEAKRRVFGTVGIDMIAGPSEILVVTDGSVPADWLALDLFSQAEHDEMAQAILISPDAACLDAVAAAIARLLPAQPRAAVIARSLADRGALIRVDDMAQAAELVNRVAPEHLELAVADASQLLADIRHAGAIFVGAWGCEALGDYCAGPSHVLPTMRTPRFSSPLGVYDFQKRSSLIEPSAEAAVRLGRVSATLARAEGLEAHAQSAECRMFAPAAGDAAVSGPAGARSSDAPATGGTGGVPSGAGSSSGASGAAATAASGQPAALPAMPAAAAFVRRCVRPDVQAMSAYAVADAQGLVKLDAMENPWPLPEDLQAALGRHLGSLPLNRYPTAGLQRRLKQAICRHDGLAGEEMLVLGNGSDELIALLCQLVAQPGAVVMAPAPSFVMYEVSSRLAGASFVPVPLQADLSLDGKAMLEAITRYRPSLVFLAYPNNPTGNLFGEGEIEAILRATDGLVVLDEAYAPFAGGASWMSRLSQWPNLAVMRTCSKWGLAGARIGYLAAAPQWVAEIDKIRPPYNVSMLDAEAAIFAFEHWPRFAEQTGSVQAEREALRQALQGLCGPDGLATVFDSAANFLLVRLTGDAPDRASRVATAMREAGVLIKDASRMHPLLASCLRLTVGTPDENRAMLAALTAALQGVPARGRS